MLSGAVAAATSSSSATTATRSTSGTRGTTNTSQSNNNPLIPTHLTTPSDKQTFLSAQREKLAVLMKALDREQRDLDLAYGSTPPGLERQLEADVERRIREASSGSAYDESSGNGDNSSDGIGMRKNRSDNSFQNIEREEFEDEEEEEEAEEKSATPRREEKERQSAGAGRRMNSGGSWNPTTWFSGAGSGGSSSAPDEAAREVRDAVQGMSSSIDRRR